MNKSCIADRAAIFDVVDRIHQLSWREYNELCRMIDDYADQGYTLSTVVKVAEKWARGLEASK